MNRRASALAAGARRIGWLDRRAAGRFDRLLLGLAALALLVTAASALGRATWLFELFTHFRFQMAAGAALLFACALARRRLIAASFAALILAANGLPLMPYVLGDPVEAAFAGSALKVMAANVSFRNEDFAALVEQVREADPDVLGLMEVDHAWMDGLAALDDRFGWSVRYPEEGPTGLVLFSKLPLRELPASPYVEDGFRAAVLVELDAGGTPLRLALAHVSAPVTPERAKRRNRQLAGIAELLKPEGGTPRILIGDLNITPWSPYYEDFAMHASLGNAARGFGYLPTWPAGINPLKIPIDHCLVSDDLHVVSFRTGDAFGSDHLPILVELAADGGLQ